MLSSYRKWNHENFVSTFKKQADDPSGVGTTTTNSLSRLMMMAAAKAKAAAAAAPQALACKESISAEAAPKEAEVTPDD